MFSYYFVIILMLFYYHVKVVQFSDNSVNYIHWVVIVTRHVSLYYISIIKNIVYTSINLVTFVNVKLHSIRIP